MALDFGDPNATDGMAGAIYQFMDAQLRPPIEEALMEVEDADKRAEVLEKARKTWRKISYAVARGVTDHLVRDPSTEDEYAEAYSSAAEDAAFWDWLADFADCFADWAALPTADPAALRTRLQAFFGDHETPDELKGVIQ